MTALRPAPTPSASIAPRRRRPAAGLVAALALVALLLLAAAWPAVLATHSPTAVWGSKQVMKYWRNLQIAEQQRY